MKNDKKSGETANCLGCNAERAVEDLDMMRCCSEECRKGVIHYYNTGVVKMANLSSR